MYLGFFFIQKITLDIQVQDFDQSVMIVICSLSVFFHLNNVNTHFKEYIKLK